MTNYLIMFLAGILGIILHSLIKVQEINKNTVCTNYKQVFKVYFSTDWISILISIFTVFTVLLIISEFINIQDGANTPGNVAQQLQYNIAHFIRTTFVVVGYCADSIVYTYLGGTQKKLQAQSGQVPTV